MLIRSTATPSPTGRAAIAPCHRLCYLLLNSLLEPPLLHIQLIGRVVIAEGLVGPVDDGGRYVRAELRRSNDGSGCLAIFSAIPVPRWFRGGRIC